MWLIKDSGGLVCVLFTYVFLFGISSSVFIISIYPLSQEGALNLVASASFYFLFVFLAFLSHLMCMLTDPGALPSLPIPNLPTCTKCKSLKPSRAHHCSTCDRCILKMDHHCPWMNNCIGYFNQKHFFLFLIYSEISCVFSIVLLIVRVAYCQIDKNSELCKRPLSDNSTEFMVGLLSMMFLGLFFLFIAVMIHDQYTSIKNNLTGIESLKKELIETRPPIENFSEVFGGKISIKWILPIRIPGNIETYLSNFKSI